MTTQPLLQDYEEHDRLENGVSFDIYVGARFLSKCSHDLHMREMLPVQFPGDQLSAYGGGFLNAQYGVAHARASFSEGVERVVFQCTEVVSVDGGKTAYTVGPRLVAKQSRHQEQLYNPKFNRTFCRTQGKAEQGRRGGVSSFQNPKADPPAGMSMHAVDHSECQQHGRTHMPSLPLQPTPLLPTAPSLRRSIASHARRGGRAGQAVQSAPGPGPGLAGALPALRRVHHR